MKKTNFIILFLFLSLGIGTVLQAQTPTETKPLTIIIVGTRQYQDINVMQKSLKSVSTIHELTQTVLSQKHIQFAGLYSGEENTIVSDIKGMAADRFEVQSKNDKIRGLVVTLKKLAP